MKNVLKLIQMSAGSGKVTFMVYYLDPLRECETRLGKKKVALPAY